jgi:hypothetical protein
VTTKPKPQRVISVTARHRVNGSIETYRIRDPRMSKEDAIAITGHWLAGLGWRREHIMITKCLAEKEDATTLAIRNRLCAP